MSKNTKRPSVNKKLQYDEHGNIIVGTFKNESSVYFNAYSCRSGAFDDKTVRNRKSKAAQKERNKLKSGNWEE
jgi:hypothetical protein